MDNYLLLLKIFYFAMDKSSNLWVPPSGDFKFEKDKAVLKSKFVKLGKKNNERTILAFPTYLVLTKVTLKD